MEIINLTPHTITFVDSDGNQILSVEPSGTVARVSCTTETIGEVNGIPVTRSFYSAITDLPDPEDGTVFVVSSMVAQRCKDRDDVLVPNESVRNSDCQIVGCRSLGII